MEPSRSHKDYLKTFLLASNTRERNIPQVFCLQQSPPKMLNNDRTTEKSYNNYWNLDFKAKHNIKTITNWGFSSQFRIFKTGNSLETLDADVLGIYGLKTAAGIRNFLQCCYSRVSCITFALMSTCQSNLIRSYLGKFQFRAYLKVDVISRKKNRFYSDLSKGCLPGGL